MNHNKRLDSNEILEVIFVYLAEISALKKHDEIIHLLADMGRVLTFSDRCTVWVVDDTKNEIWTQVAHGIERLTLPKDFGVIGESILKKEKILIDDVYLDERFNPEVDKRTGYRTKSMMVIPMLDIEDNVIGAFQVINNKSDEGIFDKRDMQRLMLASTYAAETLVAVNLLEEIEATQKEVMFTIGSIVEMKSKETANHVKRVAEYSKILALACGLPLEEAELLKQVSPMHDIGKIAIPDAILNKPGKLTKEEKEIMNTHPRLGYDMVRNSKRSTLQAAAIVSYQHHEKWDGSGYPNGLVGKNIHIYGRITAIADVFDALASDRVYKKAWAEEDILKLLREESGKHFDPELIDLFFQNLNTVYKVRDSYQDKYVKDEKSKKDTQNSITILGAFGTKAKGYGTSSFNLNGKNVIDAGNLLVGLKEESAEIENIWLTHSHLDHICDIAYILDNYFSLITKTITICGLPQTIKAIQKHFLNNIIWPDFSKIELENQQGMCIAYKAIEPNKEYVLSLNESICAFTTDHTVPSCGYIYKKNDSSILITADTYALDNVINILETDTSIKSMVIECSFPSSMNELAYTSKHLTPKILCEKLKNLNRTDLTLYINHVKPLYIEEISKEIKELCIPGNPQIVKDGEILKF